MDDGRRMEIKFGDRKRLFMVPGDVLVQGVLMLENCAEGQKQKARRGMKTMGSQGRRERLGSYPFPILSLAIFWLNKNRTMQLDTNSIVRSLQKDIAIRS